MMFFFVGCSQTTPPMTHYRVTPDVTFAPTAAEACRDKTLKIQRAFCSADLLSQTMYYRVGKHQQLSYTQAGWSIAPSEAIIQELHGMLLDSGLFKSVELYKSKSKNDLDLEVSVEEFMQYFDAELTTSHAMVRVRLTLLDAMTHEVVATKLFSKEVASDANTALGGVVALSSALGGIMDESLEFFGEACR